MKKLPLILLALLPLPGACLAEGSLAPGELDALLDEIKASEVTIQKPEKATVIRRPEKGGKGGEEQGEGHRLPAFMQEDAAPDPASDPDPVSQSVGTVGTSSSPSGGKPKRDGNGAVSEVHDGLSDVTAADLARSQGNAAQDFPASKWQAEVRAELGYDPSRPPLPDGTNASPLPAPAQPQKRAASTSAASPARDAGRRIAVYTRQGVALPPAASGKAAVLESAQDHLPASQGGAAKIPDASIFVRN